MIEYSRLRRGDLVYNPRSAVQYEVLEFAEQEVYGGPAWKRRLLQLFGLRLPVSDQRIDTVLYCRVVTDGAPTRWIVV